MRSRGAAPCREEQGVSLLVDIVTASVVKTTGVVELSVATQWPGVSLVIATALVNGVNEFNRRTRQGQEAAARKFVEQRLAIAAAELRGAEDRLEHLLATFATAFEVLEHLYRPARFLVSARRLLVPGGILLFTTLTVSGFDIQILWQHPKSVHPPHYLNLLSIDDIRTMVERCGFEVLELATPGGLDVEIVRNTVLENPTIPLSRFERHLVLESGTVVASAFRSF